MARMNWGSVRRWRVATKYAEYGYERNERGQVSRDPLTPAPPATRRRRSRPRPAEPPAKKPPVKNQALIRQNERLHEKQAGRKKAAVIVKDGVARLARPKKRRRRKKHG